MDTELQESLLDTISIVADNSVNNAKADLTIECEVVKIQDSEKGVYTVRYTENNFTAHSVNGISYAVGDSVYVLVPQGDFSKNKIIEGTTKGSKQNVIPGSGETTVIIDPTTELQDEDYYSEISDNLLIDIDDDIELCTYHTEEKIINFNDDFISAIMAYYDKFVLYADFRTDIIDLAQRANGNYGIKISIPTINKETNEKGIFNKVIDIYGMDGNYYNFEKFVTQKLFFDFEGINYDPEEKIVVTAFVKNFNQDENIITPDIFIKNIGLKAVEQLTEEELNGKFLDIHVTEGCYFLQGKYTNDKILTPQLKINGEYVDVKDYDCYWFKQDLSIDEDSEYYNGQGGTEWKILNPVTKTYVDNNGITRHDFDVAFYNLTVKKSDIITAARYKCVLVNSNDKLYRETVIIDLDSELTYSLTTLSGSTTFVKNVGTVNLLAKLHYPGSTSDITFDYIFHRFDKYGEYLDDDFYEVEIWDKVNGEDRTTQISFPVGNIDDFNIIKCEFIRKRIQDDVIHYESIGTDTITLNTGTNVFDYFLSIKNDNILYKYDADGNSPKLANYDGPYSSKIEKIDPINVRVFKATGEELSTSEYNSVEMTWMFPKKSMLILEGYDLEELEQDDNYYYIEDKNIMDLSYSIKDVYNNNLVNNTILIIADYDDNELRGKVTVNFLKDGESGTNGSQYAAIINHKITDKNGVDNWYAYGEYDSEGLPQKIRPVFVEDTWKIYSNGEYIDFGTPKFSVKVYKNGSLLKNGDYSVTWQMFDPDFTNPLFGISKNGELEVKKDWSDEIDVSVNIIQAVIVINGNEDVTTGKEYVYAYYPIDIIKLDSDQKFIPEIAKGYDTVLFESDGSNPHYNTNEEFEINIINGVNDYFTCEWETSDTFTEKEDENIEIFRKKYYPINQLVDGQSKNYIKVSLTQTPENQNLLDTASTYMSSQVTDLQNKIKYYENEKKYLSALLNKFSYDGYSNKLAACEKYLTYRAKYLSLLYDLISILALIKEEDSSFDIENYENNIRVIMGKVYNAQEKSDIVNYTNTINLNNVSNTEVKKLIELFNDKVEECKRAYNNLIIYNELDTELNKYNLIVNNIQSLSEQMTELCSAHDEEEANEDFVKLKNMVELYSSYFDGRTDDYTKNSIDQEILEPINDLFKIYRENNYIRNNYDTILEEYRDKLATCQEILKEEGQSYFNHAIVIKPVLFLLNRYGYSFLNSWDGNKVYTGENGEYLVAPQIGAGKKENGLFTGVVMGVKGKNGSNTDIGLFGLHNGQQSIFLDAKTGNADFGMAGEGQIKMRPGKTSTIAGWEINKDKLSKTIDEDAVSLYSVNASDNSVMAPNIEGDGRTKRYKAFSATDGDVETYITYDGYLYTDQAYIQGNIRAEEGYIGGNNGWIITENGIEGKSSETYIRSGKEDEDDESSGFYLSRDAICIGGISNYLKYTRDNGLEIRGNIEVSEGGTLANWIIGKDCIYTEDSVLGEDFDVDDPEGAFGEGQYFGVQGLSIGEHFRIDRYGSVYAKNSYFSGKIIAQSGELANWLIKEDCIRTDDYELGTTHSRDPEDAFGYGQYFGPYGLNVGENFRVDESGNLYTRNGYFSGQIVADSGKLANWYIGEDCLYTEGYKLGSALLSTQEDAFGEGQYFGPRGLNVGENFRVNADGTLYARNSYFSGKVTAHSGKIGPFYVGNGFNGREYIWTEYDGNINFVLGEQGAYLGGFGCFYFGNYYNPGNKATLGNYEYKGGTIIHTNGGIQTDYLTIMCVGQQLPHRPVFTGEFDGREPKGIYMEISQGQFASVRTDRDPDDGIDEGQVEAYPIVLRLIGCDTDNTPIKRCFAGLWSEGRAIFGPKDWGYDTISSDDGSHYRAMKCTVDGSLYVHKKIYCSFKEEVENMPGYFYTYRFDKKKFKDLKDDDQVVIAKHTGYSVGAEGPAIAAPGGNTGGYDTPGTVIFDDNMIIFTENDLVGKGS